jgi:hypothetical protein
MQSPESQTGHLAGLLRLLQRFKDEGVQYVLVGGQAVRLNGFLRNTEDIDILLPHSVANGERVIRALNFLPSAADLDPQWFASSFEEPENIRVADELLVDLLFAANGETFDSLQEHIKTIEVQGLHIQILNIQGLLKTKTDYREKDILDKLALRKLLSQL